MAIEATSSYLADESNRAIAVLAWIANGRLDNSFGDIQTAIAARRETLNITRRAEMQIGDRVRCVRCKPAYMIGSTGTIVRKEDEWIIVQLDPAYRMKARRFMNRVDFTVRFKVGLLELI